MDIIKAIIEIEGRISLWMEYDGGNCIKDYIDALQTAADALKEKQRNDKLKARGRLIELPCALEDKIYWTPDYNEWKENYVPDIDDKDQRSHIYEENITGIALMRDGLYINSEPDDSLSWDRVGSHYALLTLEEAQERISTYKEKWKKEREMEKEKP